MMSLTRYRSTGLPLPVPRPVCHVGSQSIGNYVYRRFYRQTSLSGQRLLCHCKSDTSVYVSCFFDAVVL